LSVDGVNVTARAAVTSSSATYVPAGLSQGAHTVTAAIADFAGNGASSASTFFLDSIPPLTGLLVDGLPVSATTLTLLSTDAIGFAATDSGTGVASTLFALDGATQTVFVSAFSLAAGTHTLAYQSVDRAGNIEALKSVSFASPTPPAVVILSPEGAGYCAVIKGIVPVLGSVAGLGLASWRLDYAPGQNAVSGFVLISSGTAAVSSGTLAGWNTAGNRGLANVAPDRAQHCLTIGPRSSSTSTSAIPASCSRSLRT